MNTESITAQMHMHVKRTCTWHIVKQQLRYTNTTIKYDNVHIGTYTHAHIHAQSSTHTRTHTCVHRAAHTHTRTHAHTIYDALFVIYIARNPLLRIIFIEYKYINMLCKAHFKRKKMREFRNI